MDESGAILCQISFLKELLDQVNEEIEANIQITREIDSDILKLSEMEKALAARESELTKTFYVSRFELSGLFALANCSKNSVEALDEQICGLKKKQEEILKRINDKQEGFVKLCLEFQKDVDKNDDLRTLLSEKEYLENEFSVLDNKNNMLQNSMQAFAEEILEDLYNCNCALQAVIEDGNRENNKLLKEIDEMKTTLLSTIIIEDDQWKGPGDAKDIDHW